MALCSYQGTGGAGPDVCHSQVLHCFILAVRQVLAFGNGGTVILAVVLDNISGLADAFNPSLQVLVKHSECPLETAIKRSKKMVWEI